MYDIITIGEILAEILAEKPDQEFSRAGVLLGPYPSGAPAIAIDQAARMGAKTAILAKIGDDDFGLLNKTRLKESGVDVSHIIKTRDNSTGTAFVTYFSNGERKFIFHFTHAACGELCPEDVDEDLIKNTKIIHINGCSITGSPSLGEAIMKALRLAQKHQVKISFDPNIRPELLRGQVMDYIREITMAADFLLTGKAELPLLFDDPIPGSQGQNKEGHLIEKLLKQKDRIIVVKDGSRGTSFYPGRASFDQGSAVQNSSPQDSGMQGPFKIDPYPAEAVDATGAGDCFNGTFLALLCQGRDLRTAALYANAAGAMAVTKRGPMEGNSGPEELERIIRENPAIVVKPLSA